MTFLCQFVDRTTRLTSCRVDWITSASRSVASIEIKILKFRYIAVTPPPSFARLLSLLHRHQYMSINVFQSDGMYATWRVFQPGRVQRERLGVPSRHPTPASSDEDRAVRDGICSNPFISFCAWREFVSRLRTQPIALKIVLKWIKRFSFKDNFPETNNMFSGGKDQREAHVCSVLVLLFR